jgi:hypothetical protein
VGPVERELRGTIAAAQVRVALPKMLTGNRSGENRLERQLASEAPLRGLAAGNELPNERIPSAEYRLEFIVKHLCSGLQE